MKLCTMMINQRTKVGTVLKQDSRALEAIVSLSPKFEKLRNPLLRSLLANRISLEEASRVAGCSLQDFYVKLAALGFTVECESIPAESGGSELPAFMLSLDEALVKEYDVRPLIASGHDPLRQIMEWQQRLPEGQTMKIINSFEPVPLIRLLRGKGYSVYAKQVSKDRVDTYFHKATSAKQAASDAAAPPEGDWNEILDRFKTKLQQIDVRHLEMPGPMHAILEALDRLPAGGALYVYHKRIPVYLLGELQERGFAYRISEVEDGEVHLIIFKS